uniref:Uncharacterized protein n=1 Tax=viral metagenome TaxID=1070528 RepID=A0A6C0AE58_9ZZZZ
MVFYIKKEVLEFLKGFETEESIQLIEDIKNNKSLYKFKEIILEDFKEPKLLEELNNGFDEFIEENNFLKTCLKIMVDLKNLKIKNTYSEQQLLKKITEIFLKNGATKNRDHETIDVVYQDVFLTTFSISDNSRNVYSGYYGILGNLIEKLFDKQSEFALGYVSFNSGDTGSIAIGLKKLQEDEDQFEIQYEIKETMETFFKTEIKVNEGSIILY